MVVLVQAFLTPMLFKFPIKSVIWVFLTLFAVKLVSIVDY